MLLKNKSIQKYIQMVIVSLVTLIIAGVTATFLGYRYTSRLNYRITDEFYTIEDIINNFETCEKAIGHLGSANNNGNDIDKEVFEAIRRMEVSLQLLNINKSSNNLEFYFSLRGLNHLIPHYREYVTDYFRSVEIGDLINAANIRLKHSNLVSFIYSYCSDLLIESVRNNQSSYIESNAIFNNVWIVLGLLDYAVVFIIIYLLYKMLHSIIQPINRLIVASNEMRHEHFTIDDISEDTDIEDIRNLIRAFNRMKHSTSQLVESLKEHNKTLELLRKQESEIQEAKRLADYAKISSLRSQMNPHFLFNTLNTIRRVAQLEGATETEDLILSLSNIFRHSLKNDFSEVSLEEEIAVTQQYYKIQKKRFGQRVELEWIIGEECNVTSLLIPPFIVEPIVENAFKHGLEPKLGKGIVTVLINIYDNTLVISIRDNGCGMSKTVLDSINNGIVPESDGSGIGLYNIISRLQILGEEYAISFSSKENEGTVVVVQMPVKNKE